VVWLRIAGAFGLKFFLKSGPLHRFAGFKDTVSPARIYRV
jgi:hypothetical protein